jgi:hypothetical protein
MKSAQYGRGNGVLGARRLPAVIAHGDVRAHARLLVFLPPSASAFTFKVADQFARGDHAPRPADSGPFRRPIAHGASSITEVKKRKPQNRRIAGGRHAESERRPGCKPAFFFPFLYVLMPVRYGRWREGDSMPPPSFKNHPPPLAQARKPKKSRDGTGERMRQLACGHLSMHADTIQCVMCDSPAMDGRAEMHDGRFDPRTSAAAFLLPGDRPSNNQEREENKKRTRKKNEVPKWTHQRPAIVRTGASLF